MAFPWLLHGLHLKCSIAVQLFVCTHSTVSSYLWLHGLPSALSCVAFEMLHSHAIISLHICNSKLRLQDVSKMIHSVQLFVCTHSTVSSYLWLHGLPSALPCVAFEMLHSYAIICLHICNSKRRLQNVSKMINSRAIICLHLCNSTSCLSMKVLEMSFACEPTTFTFPFGFSCVLIGTF